VSYRKMVWSRLVETGQLDMDRTAKGR
jgi:hypothetical protein